MTASLRDKKMLLNKRHFYYSRQISDCSENFSLWHIAKVSMPPFCTQACVPVCAYMCACTLSPWSSFVNRTMLSFATRLTQTQWYQSYSFSASVFKFCCWLVFIFVCGYEIEPRSLYMTDSCPSQAPFFFLRSSITSSGACMFNNHDRYWMLYIHLHNRKPLN